jgi:hypothetical protein
VPAGDPHVGLRGGAGVRLRPGAAPAPADTLVAFYRSNVLAEAEYRRLKRAAPRSFALQAAHLFALEAYAADFKVGNVPLVASAYTVGNFAALVNDPRVDPLRDPHGSALVGPPNVALRAVRVGNWSFLVMHTLATVAPGEELRCDYSPQY